VTLVSKALDEVGFAMEDLTNYGDSAGGRAAAGVQDAGLGMPAAVLLWPP
jgi:hypothetical protein